MASIMRIDFVKFAVIVADQLRREADDARPPIVGNCIDKYVQQIYSFITTRTCLRSFSLYSRLFNAPKLQQYSQQQIGRRQTRRPPPTRLPLSRNQNPHSRTCLARWRAAAKADD